MVMQKLISVPRTRARTPNNRTTTGFHVSDALWAVLEPLLPVHTNTHRFGGGRPRVPDRRCAGVRLGLAVDGANRPDMKLVRSTLESIVVARPEPTDGQPQGLCLDKGYDYDEVREILREFGFTAHIRSRGEEAKELVREAGV